MRRLTATTAAVFTLAVAAAPAAALADPAPAADDPSVTRVIDLTFPVAGENHYIDSYTACRGSGCHRLHKATDIMADEGAPVHAAQAGTIRWITGLDGALPGYGWMITVEGIDGRDYSYVHLGRQDGPASDAYAPGLARGVEVERGQLLGFVGCSGNASCSAPHLHLGIEDPSVATDDHYGVLRLNPYPSLVAAQERGDLPPADAAAPPTTDADPAPDAEETADTPATEEPAAEAPEAPDPWPFSDLAPAQTHADEVVELFQEGVVDGCTPTSYCPDEAVSRAQAATMLARTLDLPSAGAPFTDVSAGAAHAEGIGAAAAAGILEGRADGTFRPGAPITRAQLASLMARGYDLPAGHGTEHFPDVRGDSTHADAIAAAARAGLLQGRADDTFRPAAPTTRAQMATVLVRATD